MTLRVNESARLAVADRNYLSLPGIAQPLEALLASFLVVAARSRTIEMQPDLTLSLLATLPEDQALLRQHVEFFRSSDTRGGGILAGLQAVRTIAELMQHSAQDLLPLARRLDNGPASGSSYQADLTQFRSALNALSTPTTALDPGSGSAALQLQVAQAALSGFLNGQMADDLTRFLTAVKEANFAGDVEVLKLKVHSLQSQIDELNSDIAAGATSHILSAILFGFSIALAIGSAVTEPGLLVLEVGFAIKDEVDDGTGFAAEMKKQNDQANALVAQYRTLVESLVTDEQEMSVLLTIAGHCQAYHDSVASGAHSLAVILGQLQLLADGIEALCLVDTSDAPGFFSGQISDAATAWDIVATACTHDLELARNLS